MYLHIFRLTRHSYGLAQRSVNLLNNATILLAMTGFFSIASVAHADGPFVISGKQNAVYKGLVVSNPTGNCIEVVNNSQNITIQDSQIGPCAQSGISVSNSTSVILSGNYIHHAPKFGITSYQSSAVSIKGNRIEYVGSGVMSLESTRVSVTGNRFLNIQGDAGPGGQFVQFNRVTGPGNEISCNTGENIAGQSAPQDAINLYDSNGDLANPIIVSGNKIKGGGPSLYGGGILLGDGGGSNQIAKDNILVDPGQYGVAVAGGSNMQLLNNMIYGRQQAFTNVGVYVWDQYNSACRTATATGNAVKWTSSTGSPNPAWNAGNCGLVAGWDSNNWNASIDASIYNLSAPGCAVVTADTTSPSVAIQSPKDSTIVTGTVTITASATDNVGVAGVRFFINGSPLGSEILAAPYATSVITTTLKDGVHVFTAVARDAAGNTTTSVAHRLQVQNQVNLVDKVLPVVSFVSPANNAIVTGLVTIQVKATDNVRIAKVVILLDGRLIASLPNSLSYSMRWDSFRTTPGPHVLTALGIDSSGNIGQASISIIRK